MTQNELIILNNVVGGCITQLIEGYACRNPASGLDSTFIDLSFLCRTLGHLAIVLTEQDLPDEHLQRLQQELRPLRITAAALFDRNGEIRKGGQDVAAFVHNSRPSLFKVNEVLSVVRYWPPPETEIYFFHQQYLVGPALGWSGTDYSATRGSCLETWAEVRRPDWGDQISVFEHVGMRSGADQLDDPFFMTWEIATGRQFFTIGRVFTMLWDPRNCPGTDGYIPEEDPHVAKDRRTFTCVTCTASGPFRGPTTVRCFIVVQTDLRSMLCLSVSGSSGTGCSGLKNTQYHGIVHRHDQPSVPLAEEPDMTVPALQVAENKGPQKSPKPPGPKDPSNHIAPPIELTPNGPLPSCARIDYRRWCEIELGVWTRNVGLVDGQALLANVVEVQRMAAQTNEQTASGV